MFKFEDKELSESLDMWLAAQLGKNPQLADMHMDYMRASVVAFLYSPEASLLRLREEAENENKPDSR